MTKKENPILDQYKYEIKEVLLSEILVDEVKTKEGRRKSHSTLGTVNDVILNQISMLSDDKKYRVIEGRKRINELMAEKKKTVKAKVYKNLPVDIDRYVLLVSNFQRSASPVTEAEAIRELIKQGKNIEEISKITGISESTLNKRLSLLKKLPKEVLDLLRAGKIPESTANKIAALPKDIRAKITKEEKITGDVVERYHRDYLNKQLRMEDMELPKKVKGEAKVLNYQVKCGKIEKKLNRRELLSYLEDTLSSISKKDEIVITRI